MRALVVDDSRAMRRILTGIMSELDFAVTDAGNGREAIARLDEMGVPDVVLVDWNMPEMNGLDFVTTVRADARYERLPILMITTETETEQLLRALGAGVNEYVMKPFNKEAILDKLQLLQVV